MIRSKRISFAWAGLSKYCILDAHHTIITGTRVHSMCTFVEGELPQTLVSGSGAYRCVSVMDEVEQVFELWLNYFEVDKLCDTVYVQAIINVEKSRPQLPLGLFAAQT